jgi:hexosaminidase
VGGWRDGIGFKLDASESTTYGPDGRYGGFYTESDVRELVAYAAQRNVEIIPEIEMPGHSMASLAAYPEHGCTGGPYRTGVSAGIFDGILCPGQETTFEFVDNILSEVTRLFPSEFIHIGGDEVDKETWKKCARCQARIKSEGLNNEQELQSYFIRRVAKLLEARGRTLIGWSEIREGGLAKDAVLMDWIGGGSEAAAAGHKVIMTPTTYCYLDYYQSTNRAAEPRAIGGFLPLEKAYSFEPVPSELRPDYQGSILGVQGNLWTEYIPSLKHAEYMMYPRLSALAEVTWSSPPRDYRDFTHRLAQHLSRLDIMGINYRRGSIEP